MKQAALPKMTVDEFLFWSECQPDGKYELFDGEVVRQSHDGVSMQAERVAHTEVKANIYAAFRAAIREAQLPCRPMIDGALVPIAKGTSYRPDVLAYCGERADPDSLVIENPVVVVEVLSEGTAKRDMSDKPVGYFSLESVAHYIVVDTEKRRVLHYFRGESGTLITQFLTNGALRLVPPGFSVDIADFFVQL